MRCATISCNKLTKHLFFFCTCCQSGLFFWLIFKASNYLFMQLLYLKLNNSCFSSWCFAEITYFIAADFYFFLIYCANTCFFSTNRQNWYFHLMIKHEVLPQIISKVYATFSLLVFEKHVSEICNSFTANDKILQFSKSH